MYIPAPCEYSEGHFCVSAAARDGCQALRHLRLWLVIPDLSDKAVAVAGAETLASLVPAL